MRRSFLVFCRDFHDTIEIDVFVGSSLVDKFHAESGCIGNAHYLFDKLFHRDCVSWNVMLNDYVICGESEYSERKHDSFDISWNVEMAYKIFSQSITIDLVMCTAVISGYVLNRMKNDALEMFRVELYCRVGRLNEAFEIINSMPFPHDARVGETLFGVCRAHGNVELAEVASRHLFI
ncbi:hypothetical protein Ddye_014637 [Dipteronia dyeriana]|uniref:Pentatricopeptide repeat-containing protein n=1 Tax=Dipteronia dyeriana TaxID=168575 RepID=A0AAD9X876_9ROSI|nr:hypothetical protein Ddye_014637 [Dipteronia dyeriana]